MARLTTQQIREAGLSDWRMLNRALHTRFRTGDFVSGLRLVTSITELAERANHHPDVTLGYPHVDLRLVSHDVGAVTQRDVDLAREISRVAREQGVAAQPEAVAQVEIGLDTADAAVQTPFWAALLRGDPDAVTDGEVVDPGGQLPTLWFQGTDRHETPRQRFHLDVWVPHDVAEERIAAAVAAGGRVVDDSRAPSFTVLTDPEGNRACVCTFLDG